MAAITASDIRWKLSTTSGSAGNTTASTAGNSLGKYCSTTEVTGSGSNEIFLDITGSENASSQVDYQCVFVHNTNSANSLQNAVVWVSADVVGGAAAAIGVDTTASSAVGSSTAQALTIANSTTAPSGVSFSAPTTAATGLSLGNIPAGYVKAVWIRRTAANTTALSNDGVTLSVQGDTGSL